MSHSRGRESQCKEGQELKHKCVFSLFVRINETLVIYARRVFTRSCPRMHAKHDLEHDLRPPGEFPSAPL